MEGYVPRFIDKLLADYLAELPAVMLVGPRACGKTTTAAKHAGSIVRLDSDDAAAFNVNVDAGLRGRPEPVLLDEWQVLPEVLGAVKRAVDNDRRPGRYLITGSARSDTAEHFWPGTGRIVIVCMYPLTVAEQQYRPPVSFIDRVTNGDTPTGANSPTLDVRDYLELAWRGGFPEPALQLGETTAGAWLESYADQVAMRDARAFDRTPDARRLFSYLEAYALNSSGTVHQQTLYNAAGINRKTALAYDGLLRDLMIIDELPAWSSNRFKRLSRMPKRYIIDSGLLAGILRINVEDVLASSNLLGNMIDTFVVAQLRAETALATTRYRLSHLREQNGRHEVDVIAELGGGRIIGIEIKAAAKVGHRDARHLQWLKETIGDRFAAGIVFHTGKDTFELADQIIATPISALWS